MAEKFREQLLIKFQGKWNLFRDFNTFIGKFSTQVYKKSPKHTNNAIYSSFMFVGRWACVMCTYMYVHVCLVCNFTDQNRNPPSAAHLEHLPEKDDAVSYSAYLNTSIGGK